MKNSPRARNLSRASRRGLAILASVSVFTTAHASQTPPLAPGVIYVRADLATGADNGTSWTDAFRGRLGLKKALATIGDDDQVWLARGTYTTEPPGGARTTSFQITHRVSIYGGFIGTETTLDQRDIAANPTIISADLNGDDAPNFVNRADNTCQIFFLGVGSPPLTIDGVTITGGEANTGSQSEGAGIELKPGARVTLRRVTFIENRARYAACVMGLSGNTISCEACTFLANTATKTGGAVWLAQGTAAFTNCRFERNRGDSYGGAIHVGDSGVSCAGCTFLNNTSGRGAAVDIAGSSPKFINCTFVNNVSDGTWSPLGSIFINYYSCHTSFRNCIFRELNPFVIDNGACEVDTSYCCFAIPQMGEGNIGGDPLFVDLEHGDLRLLPGSPCIDAGRNDLVPLALVLDAATNPRFADEPTVPDTGVGTAPIVDLGAYEVQGHSCPADFNFDGFVTGADYDAFVEEFLSGRARADFDHNGFVTGDDFDAYVLAFETGC